jgi:hypothetical protein
MDPVAILRIWPVVVTLGEEEFQIPALPAADWVEAILTRDATAIVPGLLLPEDEAEVLALLMDGEVEPDEVLAAARDAIEAAAGRPWWEATRLVGSSGENGDTVFGSLVQAGFDFEKRSLAALCAVIYAMATANMDKKDRAKFDMDLKAVPAEILRDDEDALEAAFMAAMAERGQPQ